MLIGGLAKCSTIDFPGRIACVVFTRGCDLDCFYCHNRPLIQRQGETLPEAEALTFLNKRKGLLEGVVLSGGSEAAGAGAWGAEQPASRASAHRARGKPRSFMGRPPDRFCPV